MTVDRQHDRLVEPALHRLRLGEGCLGVRAGDLGPSRQRLVGHPPPRADHAPDAGLDLDIVAERNRVDEERAVQVVQPDADLLARRVEQRPDVDVRLELIAAQKVQGEVDELFGRVGQRHSHHVGRSLHPVVMRCGLEQVQLVFLLVPVGADPFENRGPVVKRVSHEAELHVVVAREISLEEDPRVRVGRRLLHRGLGFRVHTHRV